MFHVSGECQGRFTVISEAETLMQPLKLFHETFLFNTTEYLGSQ
jgi:hypothetical protein